MEYELPTLESVANICERIAHQISDIASLPMAEPGGDIEAFETKYGHGVMADPLKTVWDLTRAYLTASGDLLWNLATTLLRPPSSPLTPATLARQSVEYAALSYYLSAPGTTAIERVARIFPLWNSSFDRAKAHPDYSSKVKQARTPLNEWWKHFKKTVPAPFPKVPPHDNFTELINSLTENKGGRQYRELSRIAHPNAMTITTIFQWCHPSTPSELRVRSLEKIISCALFAANCSWMAGIHVYNFREQGEEFRIVCMLNFATLYNLTEDFNAYMRQFPDTVEADTFPRG